MSRPHAEDPHFPTPTRPAGAPVNRGVTPAPAGRFEDEESRRMLRLDLVRMLLETRRRMAAGELASSAAELEAYVTGGTR